MTTWMVWLKALVIQIQMEMLVIMCLCFGLFVLFFVCSCFELWLCILNWFCIWTKFCDLCVPFESIHWRVLHHLHLDHLHLHITYQSYLLVCLIIRLSVEWLCGREIETYILEKRRSVFLWGPIIGYYENSLMMIRCLRFALRPICHNWVCVHSRNLTALKCFW